MIDISKINSNGVQFIPVRKNKKPYPDNWQQNKVEYDYSKAEGVGLVCGRISGNVEAIDFDLKYDLTKNLMKDYCDTLKKLEPELFEKMVIQKTISGGYHFIYKCSFIEGNQKLANRATIENERLETYKKSYAHALDVQKKTKSEAEVIAKNAKDSDKVRVLIETRGDGGYVVCYPTENYKMMKGSLDKIQTITPQERSTLINIAFTFNEVVKPSINKTLKPSKDFKGTTPGDDYNNRGQVVDLLEKHGWLAVGRRGNKILMKRPGDTKADHSGNFDEELNRFSVFSTSTVFEAQTSYMRYAVYAMLECDGDYSEAIKRLAAEGYGDSQEEIKAKNEQIPSIVDMGDDNDLSFFATDTEDDCYLDAWRKGTFEMGKTTGIPELDSYFLFKEGNLVAVNGIDNVGKSSVVWYLAMLSALYHGWNWVIFSSENRTGGVRRKLIEFYWSVAIDEQTEEQYKIAKEFVREHFSIIKCGETMYNYRDILNMTTKAMKHKNYKGLMIDPYNSLKVDIPKLSRQGIYDYHYEASSVIQLFGRRNNISIYVNQHAGTPAARNKDKSGYTRAPQKEDSEMGVIWANKSDEFITIHRVTQSETDWMYTEFHVRKVKEKETGGGVTYFSRPVDLMMVNNYSGFISVPNRGTHGSGSNAILAFHRRNSMSQIDLIEPIKEQVNEEQILDLQKKWPVEISLNGHDPSQQDDVDIAF